MTTAYDELFEVDRPWLEKQPGMRPWPEGCAMLAAKLDSWLNDYCRAGCCQVVTPQCASYATFIESMWQCWRHHWCSAIAANSDCGVDGVEIARAIRDGRGYLRGGQLGGDPLADVVLAQAVLVGDSVAAARFERDYKTYCIAQGKKANRMVAHDPDDWWCQLLDKLLGYSNPPGKLGRFSGRCGLKHWLGTVARRFALDYPPRPTAVGGDQDALSGTPTPPADDPETAECEELLAGFLRVSLGQIPSDDRLVLALLFVDQLPGKDVAGIFHIVPGALTRRKQRALEKLQAAMHERATELEKRTAYKDCLDFLLHHRNYGHFAQLIYRTLEESRTEGPGPGETEVGHE